MKVALMVITDGRICFHDAMDSLEGNFDEFDYHLIVDYIGIRQGVGY